MYTRVGFSSPDSHWSIHAGNMIFGDSRVMKNDRYVPSVHAILQSGNLYMYVMHNPVMFDDPTGLSARMTITGQRLARETAAIAVSPAVVVIPVPRNDGGTGAVTGFPAHGSSAGQSGQISGFPTHQQIWEAIRDGLSITARYIDAIGYAFVVTIRERINSGNRDNTGLPSAAPQPGTENIAMASGGNPTRPGAMQREVERGQAPREAEMVHGPHGNAPGARPHVHWRDGTAQNDDGTIHDRHRGTPSPSNRAQEWLRRHNWIPNIRPRG